MQTESSESPSGPCRAPRLWVALSAFSCTGHQQETSTHQDPPSESSFRSTEQLNCRVRSWWSQQGLCQAAKEGMRSQRKGIWSLKIHPVFVVLCHHLQGTSSLPHPAAIGEQRTPQLWYTLPKKVLSYRVSHSGDDMSSGGGRRSALGFPPPPNSAPPAPSGESDIHLKACSVCRC
jgi:hypothetical protein